MLAQHVDVDLWDHTCPEGQSIRMGFEYLLQYADPQRKWPHDQIGSINPQRSLASLLHRVQVTSIGSHVAERCGFGRGVR